MSEYHYLPLAPPFFFILVGLFVILLVLIQLGVLRYAYMRLGVSPRGALVLLFASLLGSYFNIPLVELPEQQMVSGQEIEFFGMRYVVPTVVEWPGTVLAVNVGGAVIPTLMSTYLVIRYQLWRQSVSQGMQRTGSMGIRAPKWEKPITHTDKHFDPHIYACTPGRSARVLTMYRNTRYSRHRHTGLPERFHFIRTGDRRQLH